MNHLERRDLDAAIFSIVVNLAILAEFRTFDFVTTGRQGIEAGFDIPFVDAAQVFDYFIRAGWSPDPQRGGPSVCPATDPEMVNSTDMIDMVMCCENLVDVRKRDFKGGKILRCSRSAIKQEFVRSGFYEYRRTGLAAPWKGGSCTCLLYTSPSPRDGLLSRMPSSA